MNCQQCELLLAQRERNEAVANHLRECPDCRALAEEFAANAAVLESLRTEELPPIDVKTPRRRIYGYAAVAAALLIGMQSPRPHAPPAAPEVSQEAPPQPSAAAGASPAHAPEPVPAQKLQPLKIKMLTPDPDVVIYWIVD